MPQLIIQPSTIDNYLDSGNPTTNRGGLTYLYVGKGAVSVNRTILKFDFTALPAGTIISSAPLSLYVGTVTGTPGRTLWAYRLTQIAWTELGSTWNTYDGVNAWASAGGDYTTTNGVSLVGPAAGNWATWDVLQQAQYAHRYTGKILYVLIKDGTEAANKNSSFRSREYTTNTTLCPKFTINYKYTDGLWMGHG